jgi:hypothetical protein
MLPTWHPATSSPQSKRAPVYGSGGAVPTEMVAEFIAYAAPDPSKTALAPIDGSNWH